MQKSPNILIIDDNIDLSQNLNDVLTEIGYNTVVALDGKSAINHCKKKHFDLALVDMKLPDIDGLELIEKLLEILPELEYIIITAYGTLESAKKATGLKKIVAYELKPLDMDHLLDLIHQVIERKMAEDEIKESEEQYRSLTDALPQFIYRLDKDLKYVSANKAYCKVCGISCKEIKGKTSRDIFPKELADQYMASDRKIIETEKMQVHTEKSRSIGGKDKWVCVTKLPVKDNKGNVNGMIGIYWDITELKQTEEKLRKTRERLELAMDAGEHGFWDWNLDTNDVYFSPCYCTMLGYKPDELPMKLESWVNLMHPDDRKTIVPEVENYVKNAQPYEVEFRLKTKNGDWKWISGRGKSYEKDDDGVSHRAVGVHVDITDSKKADKELRESEEKMRIILNSMPDIVLQLDTNLKIIWANKATIQLNPDAVGQLCYKALPGRNTPCPNCPIIKASKTGQIEQGVVHLKSVTGVGESYWDDIGIPVKDTQGKITSIVKLARNITEKMKAKETLKQSEESYRDLFDNATDAIYIQDKEGRFLDVNQGAVDMYGYPKDFFIGKTPEFLSAPGKNNMEKIIGFVEDAFNGKPRQYDFWGIRKNGEVFPKIVRSQKVSYLGEDSIITFALDITERKQAEEKLRESEEKFRDMANLLPQIVYEIDINGNLTFVNKQAFDSFGYSQEEYEKGINVLQTLIPEDRDRAKENIQNMLYGKEVANPEYTVQRKDGSTFPVLIYSSAILKDNKPVGLRGIIVDITERKQVEEELAKYREHLEERVQERTKELEEKNEKLAQFNKLFVDREFRIKELKDKIKELEKKLSG